MISSEKMIAEYLAKGGKVTKCKTVDLKKQQADRLAAKLQKRAEMQDRAYWLDMRENDKQEYNEAIRFAQPRYDP